MNRQEKRRLERQQNKITQPLPAVYKPPADKKEQMELRKAVRKLSRNGMFMEYLRRKLQEASDAKD